MTTHFQDAVEEIQELADIEALVRAGHKVPHARRYQYRVNKQIFVSETAEITRERILERAGLVPTDQYRLRLKRRHGPPEEVKPGQVVDLRAHGIERFIAQPKEVQDGLTARREFDLSAADQTFLDSLKLHWDAITHGGRLWIVVLGIPLPVGFQVGVADVAIEIAAGYPTSQLDMAYFYPPLALADGRPLNCVDAIEQLEGKGWQRWSRHRVGMSVWVPGVDDLEKHFAYVQDWLCRAVES